MLDPAQGAVLAAWILAATGLAAAGALGLMYVRLQRRAALHLREARAANRRLRMANDILLRRADVDTLTGLPNRQLFEERLRQAFSRLLRRRERSSTNAPLRLAVMMIDLDRLGAVNESLGSPVGDLLLKEAATRIRTAVRATDMVARYGGDGFLVLMEDLADIAESSALAQRLVLALQRPYELKNHSLEISASVGIAVHPEHGERDELVNRAATAMRTAKQAGGCRLALFDPVGDASTLEQLALLTELRHAAELGQLMLHYQPKVDAQRGVIRGVEALLRWNHPQRGMVSPLVFIPMAERGGLIQALGLWVIEEACRQMQAWADEGIRLRVAVNVSAHQLRDDGFLPSIERALNRHRIEPSQLLCEITESVLLEDVENTRRVFEGLGRLGVYLSIDDFGTGYSSLSRLCQLPAQQLKIDRSFVKDLESSADARAIVDAVIRLAHALSLKVVAEGVETACQRDILLGLECDELQGFYYAKPMPAASVVGWAFGNRPTGGVDFSPSVVDWSQSE